MRHMRDKLSVGNANGEAEAGLGSQPSRTGTLPKCPGCDEGNCSDRIRIVEHLLRTDHAEEFASAVNGGWDGLWAFGINCAKEIWPDGRPPADAPYCILMNIAALAGYDEQTCRKLRRNLAIFRDRAKEQEQ